MEVAAISAANGADQVLAARVAEQERGGLRSRSTIATSATIAVTLR